MQLTLVFGWEADCGLRGHDAIAYGWKLRSLEGLTLEEKNPK